MDISKLSDREVLDLLNDKSSKIARVRREFVNQWGRIEQADYQRRRAKPIELRRMELEAALKLIEVASTEPATEDAS